MEQLKAWRFEASNNNTDWTTLMPHKDDKRLCGGAYRSRIGEGITEKKKDMFVACGCQRILSRITMQENYSSDRFLILGGFEVNGTAQIHKNVELIQCSMSSFVLMIYYHSNNLVPILHTVVSFIVNVHIVSRYRIFAFKHENLRQTDAKKHKARDALQCIIYFLIDVTGRSERKQCQ